MARLVLHCLCSFLLLALGSSQPEDFSALLQTGVQGIPDEPDSPEGEGNSFKGGDKIEVVIISGRQAGKWIKGVIIKPGANPLSYDILLSRTSGVPKSKRIVVNVPAAMLRPLAVDDEEQKSDGVLLFWAVNSKPYVMDLVTKNIDHFRQTYKGRAEVFLVHYDGNRSAWLSRDEAWYRQNVQYSEETTIPKEATSMASMFDAKEYYPPQITFALKYGPQLLGKRTYEWVWMLDEDVDLTGVNLNKYFDQADDASAFITAPAVKFEDRYKEKGIKMYKAGCSKKTPMCAMHLAVDKCQYRYTNFVEAMFPMVRPDVINDLSVCPECASAIDRIWCSRISRNIGLPEDETCAILDEVTVVHTNPKPLRKWELMGSLADKDENIRSASPEDYVESEDFKTYSCIA
mmetsp:Transcript_50311/g.150300  ORF Transcript_50311/g.150300 Transcript_50311/m.150300 type:complete len:403 (-) Transcript_50311:116-1324(-)